MKILALSLLVLGSTFAFAAGKGETTISCQVVKVNPVELENGKRPEWLYLGNVTTQSHGARTGNGEQEIFRDGEFYYTLELIMNESFGNLHYSVLDLQIYDSATNEIKARSSAIWPAVHGPRGKMAGLSEAKVEVRLSKTEEISFSCNATLPK